MKWLTKQWWVLSYNFITIHGPSIHIALDECKTYKEALNVKNNLWLIKYKHLDHWSSKAFTKACDTRLWELSHETET